MPRPPNPTDHLDAVRHLMGTMPDQELATLAGSTAPTVGRYRRAHGIPAHRGAAQPDGSEGAPDQPGGPPVRRTRASPLDAYRDQMGKVPDEVIAEQAGVTRQGVRQYRERHNIPLEEGLQPRRGRPRANPDPALREPDEAAGQDPDSGETPSEAPTRKRKRRSRLDPYRAEVGKVPDAILAEKAGVTVQAVRQYRLLHNIVLEPSADRRRGAASEVPPPTALSERLDTYAGLIGQVDDREIAAMAEVAPSLVLQYRRDHSIPATWEPERQPPASALQPALSSVPATPPRAEEGLHAYAVRVRAGERESEYALFATDLIAAATQAGAVLAAWPVPGRLIAVRYIGPALA